MSERDASDWIDVSVPVTDGMIHWPDDPQVKLELWNSIEAGDPANVTRLDLSAHTGTHVDAPRHFFDSGPAIDAMTLAAMIGPARVIEITDSESVGEAELTAHDPRPGERLLLRTQNSSRPWAVEPFREDFVNLAPAAARLLARRGVRAVGIDYLSIGGMVDGRETHEALLGAGIWIVEGLDLSSVEPGAYEFLCLPLRLVGSDGAPARALLRDLGPTH